MDCIFCKIAAGDIPASKVYEDDKMLVFNDLNPQAPVHLLAIPKAHIPSANHITAENAALLAHLFAVIPSLVQPQGLQSGYRIVNNCGEHGQQSVQHLHFHILGGRQLQWPPG
jgi:Diadenosine tetraphosphate (Ap4A) hydrolase and other HIT family hydrolases